MGRFLLSEPTPEVTLEIPNYNIHSTLIEKPLHPDSPRKKVKYLHKDG